MNQLHDIFIRLYIVDFLMMVLQCYEKVINFGQDRTKTFVDGHRYPICYRNIENSCSPWGCRKSTEISNSVPRMRFCARTMTKRRRVSRGVRNSPVRKTSLLAKAAATSSISSGIQNKTQVHACSPNSTVSCPVNLQLLKLFRPFTLY